MLIRRLLIILLGVVVAGCTNLADVERAKRSLKLSSSEAAREQAISDLQFLAVKGYVEAQGELASYYSQVPTSDARAKAARWFKRVSDKTDRYESRYLRWLASNAKYDSTLYDEAVSRLSKRMQSDGDVALQLISLLQANNLLTDEKIASILALIQGENGADDKIFALSQLRDLSPFINQFDELCSNPRSLVLECLLGKLRWAKTQGSESVQKVIEQANNAYKADKITEDGVERLLSQLVTTEGGTEPGYPEFAKRLLDGALDTNTELFLRYAQLDEAYVDDKSTVLARLNALISQGNNQAAVIYADLLISGEHVVAAPKEGERLLLTSIVLSEAKLELGRLYLSGKLGYVKLQEGVNWLIESGRQGNEKAYRELFRVFSGTPGIQVNKVYAHTFAGVYELIGHSLTLNDTERLLSLTLTDSEAERTAALMEQEIASTRLLAR